MFLDTTELQFENPAVGELKRQIHMLLDDNDRGSLPVHRGHEGQQLLDDDRGQTQGQLVDHHQLRAAHERARQEQLLLLAAGQRARVLIHAAGEPGEILEDPLRF